MRLMTPSIAIAAAALALAGCAHRQVASAPAPVYGSPAPVYGGAPGYGTQGYGGPVPTYGSPVPAQGQYPVAHASVGHVENIETLRGESRTRGGGAVLGGVIGAVAGRNVVGGSDRAAGTLVGAVAGALIGNQIEKNNSGLGDVYRVTIRMNDGSVRAFDYAQLNDLRIGERVRVDGNQVYRY